MSNSLRPHELQHARLLLSITISLSLLKLMSTESVMTSNHLILCHPLSLFPSIFPSIRFFSSESVLCIKWLKYLCFSFSISPSNQYSGLSSFRIDWFDLLAAQELSRVFSSTTVVLGGQWQILLLCGSLGDLCLQFVINQNPSFIIMCTL